jgi:hypothetical protein
MAVRRQADLDPRVASLAKLLSEIRKSPELLTRDWWVGMWNIDDDAEPHKRTYATGQWNDSFGGDIGGYLDPSIPTRDMNRLRKQSEAVTKYVDKHIAHSEDPGPESKDPGPAPAGVTLTLDDVNAAIDLIGETFTLYYSPFTATGMAFLEPAIQHDWLAPFRQRWIRPSAPP